MKTRLIAIALAAAFPLGAYAQGTPSQPGQQQRPAASSPTQGGGGLAPGVSRLDTNRDGLISRDEAKASTDLSARFGELDKNGDGSLSADEISNASSAPSGGSSPMKR